MVAPAIMAAATAPATIASDARTAPNSTPPGSELTMRAQYAPSNAPVWHPFE